MVLREYRDMRNDMTRSKVVHVPMRDGEKPGVKLVADMSYWESQGMRADVPFVASIRKTIGYMSQMPEVELLNAYSFYWG